MTILKKIIYEKLEIDDHDVPGILVREDGHIVVFFSKHQSAGPMQRVISTNPEDISSFSTPYTWGNNVSYPNPYRVGDDIYLLYRGLNWHPTLAISRDNGLTFTDIRQLVLGGGARPYARYCQSADGSIHVAMTTGHPRNEAQNKIYYFRLKDNNFYKANGDLIKEFTTGIDIDKNEAEIAYDGISNGRGWVWDMTIDPVTQNPVIVYASFPTEDDHRYNYAYWDGNGWVNKEIVKSGKWFPQTPAGKTEPEPHYSGGLSMDYNDPWTIYLSKQVNGVFEIFKYVTGDKGNTWQTTAITSDTPADLVNVRPIVPRNHKDGYFDVLWMRGKYEYYYQKYQTSIVYQMRNRAQQTDRIEFENGSLELTIGRNQQLKVNFYPFIVKDKTLTWTSSNEAVAAISANGTISALTQGTTVITAETFDGKKANCNVTVTQPDHLTAAFFDFGTENSPVVQGAIAINETTLLSGSYGWLTPVTSRDRGTSLDSERRDFNMGPDPTHFVVYVENGIYDVSILQGDPLYMHDKMQIKVNGDIKVNEVTSQKNEFIISRFDVTVTNNEMDFEFSRHGTDPNWVVNSLRFERTSTSVNNITEEDKFLNPETVVTVYDIAGKKLVQEKTAGKTYTEILTNNKLSSGIYILYLKLGKDEKVLKFSHK